MRGRRVRSRCLRSGIFFTRSGGGTGGTDIGAVDEPQVPVDFALSVEADLQGFENAVEGSIASPTAEAVVDGLPFSIAFGEVAPGSAGAEDPEHSVEQSTVVFPFATAFLFGEKAFEKFPMFVRDFVSRHRILLDAKQSALPNQKAQYLTCAVLGIRQTEPRQNRFEAA